MASEWMAGLKRDDFAADSLIGSDVVSAADFRIGSDAAIAMESGWIAGTNKRLVLCTSNHATLILCVCVRFAFE